MLSVSEHQARLLQTAVSSFGETLDKFSERLTKATSPANPNTEKWGRFQHMALVHKTMSVLPGGLLMQAVVPSEWISVEISERFTDEFVEALRTCKEVYAENYNRADFLGLGVLILITDSLIQQTI